MCSLLNIVLDLLLVVVFQTGVAGAAAATVLSEAIAAVLCIIYAFKKVPQFGQAFIYRKPDAKLIKKTMQVGIPTGFQYALIYVSSIFLIALGGVQILRYMLNGAGDSMLPLSGNKILVIRKTAFRFRRQSFNIYDKMQDIIANKTMEAL